MFHCCQVFIVPFLLLIHITINQLGVSKRPGEGTTRTADPYWPYHMMSCLEIKAQGKEEEGGTFMVMAFTTRVETLSSRKQLDICLTMEISELISFFALLKHQAFAFPIKPSVSQSMSMLTVLLFSPCPMVDRVSKMLGWCLAVGWGQPTTDALQLEWLYDSMIFLHTCFSHIL